MGKLVYGGSTELFEIEDAVLAHLRVVAMNKLRRNEPFFLHVAGSRGPRSLWVHASIPLVFHFYGSRAPRLDREWIDELMRDASGPNGLDLPAFPPARDRVVASRALAVDRRDDAIDESGHDGGF